MDVPISAKTTAQHRNAPRLPPRTLIRRRPARKCMFPSYKRRYEETVGNRPRPVWNQHGFWVDQVHSLAMDHDAVARRGQRPGDLRVVVRRPAKLPRTLGAPALFAACYANVGSSIYYALGVTSAFALGLTPPALILAGFIFVTTALNYAEGSAALPHAGGSSQFARRAFNAPIGFLVGWVQLLNYTATVSISAYFATSYLAGFGKYFWLFGRFRSSHPWQIGSTSVLL